MRISRNEILAVVLAVVALVLVLPQVDLPAAVSVNRNAAALVGTPLAPNALVSARIAPLHHQNSLLACSALMSFVGEVVLHPHPAPALNLLCTLRC
jgi:hypothetical protein